jgi:pyridoxal phosphate enzyme (YggS family)
MKERESELRENLARVHDEIAPYSPELIVVTKTYPISDVEILRDAGATNFGENRNEEGVEKSAAVSARWHYQGEIQSKKLRSILSWADVIHSLDDLDHAQKIHRILTENSTTVEAFIQLSLDGDPARGGVLETSLATFAANLNQLDSIGVLGIMCVPPVSMEPKAAFEKLAEIHRKFALAFPAASSLSAGMSGDYLLALEHGATHIRVGSKILGARQYPE